MRKWALWLWLLTKRLLKKKTFAVLLLMLSLLVVCCAGIDWEDSGMVTVVLAAEKPGDVLAAQVIAELREDSSWIRFLETESTEAAVEMVRQGQADAAWIFPEDMAARIAEFVQNKSATVMRIVQREESVLLRLTAETLNGALFGLWAEPVYLNYLTQMAPELATLPEEMLLTYPTWFEGNGTLFEFTTVGGMEQQAGEAFLVTPLRGLLGIWIFLCAMAAAMYFAHDQARGVFAACPGRQLPGIECCSFLAALPGVSLAALAALGIAGLWENAGRQILVATLYLPCCGCFAALLRRVCRNVQTMAAVLPVLTVAMLLICPVFFDLALLGPVQYLLPPTYYIQGLYSDKFLLLMPLYSAVCLAGCFCFRKKR